MSNADPFLKERVSENNQRINAFQQPSAPVVNPNPSLRDYVEQAVSNYFSHLEGQDVTEVYDMVLSEVEIPLLEVVMKYTRHNPVSYTHLTLPTTSRV